jgi:hypothetical protein
MQTIQVAVDVRLLRATDNAARRKKVDRSALVREALREHLKRLEQRDSEKRDRLGYKRYPESDELSAWEAVAEWPIDQSAVRFDCIDLLRRTRNVPSSF